MEIPVCFQGITPLHSQPSTINDVTTSMFKLAVRVHMLKY